MDKTTFLEGFFVRLSLILGKSDRVGFSRKLEENRARKGSENGKCFVINARNSPTLQLTKQIVFAFNQFKLCFFGRVDNPVEPNESNYVA